MAAIAEQTGALISAVLLGAVAGAAVLPFRDEAYRAAIRATAKSVDANLAAFEAGAAAARAAAGSRATAVPAMSTSKRDVSERSELSDGLASCPCRWPTRIDSFSGRPASGPAYRGGAAARLPGRGARGAVPRPRGRDPRVRTRPARASFDSPGKPRRDSRSG